jgi:N-acylneuraminate cytidylyltransferase
MRVAIIPARGGSKRIPRKNIKPFYGIPMIAWSIRAAQQSECFDCVLVSTDDQEIATIARQYGAETPFLRPASLSDDCTGIQAVVAHAIEWLQEKRVAIDLVCCIFATAPFVRAEDLKSSLKQVEAEDADYCFSVTSYPFPIQRSIRITKANRCEMFQPDMFNQRSQDLEEAYHDAGQFYWGKASAWFEEKSIFTTESIPYILPRYRVQDIDTPEDWKMAELLFRVLQESK